MAGASLAFGPHAFARTLSGLTSVKIGDNVISISEHDVY